MNSARKRFIMAVTIEPRHGKPVFDVSDQVRHKSACADKEARWRLEISDIETLGIILSRQRATKVLIRLYADAQADLHLCCSHIA